MKGRAKPPPLMLHADSDQKESESKCGDPFAVGSLLGPAPAESEAHLDEVKLGKVLGRGASGTVCLAKHLPTGRYYAHKTVPLSLDLEARKKVGAEAQLNMSGQHPHVVRMVEGRIKEGSVRFLMEFMNRGSLQDLYQATQSIKSEAVLAALAKQALLGLAHLHSVRRVMHRDVKPANLLLNSDGMLKIADLGVGVTIRNTTDVAESWVGTVTYMAPERIRGDPYTASADMWSLGLTLAECAVGEFPYCKRCGQYPRLATFWDVLNTVCTLAPPALPREEYSPAFCDFVARCLGRTKADRPPANVMLHHPFITAYDDGRPDWHVRCVREYLEEVRVELKATMERRIAQANEDAEGVAAERAPEDVGRRSGK